MSSQRLIKQTLSQRTLRRFAEHFKGEMILPEDRRYSRARRVWNQAVNQYPQLMARCVNREDVSRAIQFAGNNELLTAVRAGGHSFAGHGVCDGGIVVDLSPMTQVTIDPMSKLVRIAPG